MEFISIYDLLEKGISHGSIATAMESKKYIYGWDRFGRYQKFELKVSDEVFDLLAADYTWASEPTPDRLPRDIEYGEFPRLAAFGWPESEKMNFSDYENTGESIPANPRSSPKAQDNNLRIIGALRACLVGEDRDGFNESCKKFNDSSLIDFLGKRYGEYPGLSKRNLETKFAIAKQLIENP